ncbi:putative DNA polymerase N-terminal domain protein [Cyanobium sp. PCC 7001]|uniref:hypothetical protein n=1 Tax=Cyanobium sp. PCC 7001 TaxID=180281 RepID=UPI0001805521|nr:hypothetical protein [Cyanobium sp. PCC 7001]EDY37731.1 putative DNA polymerase N-terminal domain protein [Cyanobium sp. PCC 7001]
MAACPAAPGPERGAAERSRLRGRLLEFLKFRVLAAQEAFFTGFGEGQPANEAPANHDPTAEANAAKPVGPAAARLREWLHGLGVREFDRLDDDDLLAVLATARRLYVD